jgi:class 3 adenylate cyclase
MKAFSMLLDRLIAATPEQRPAIEQVLRDAFGKRKAVLALDMSNFTLSVRRDGILPYLCRIRQMHRLTLPIVQAHLGEVVKYDADNLLAVFDEPECAVQAAIAMHQASAESAQQGSNLAFSIGIDYGEVLLIAEADCFGDAVNLAYKLGEDIAQPGEVLISPAVREQLGAVPPFRLRELQLSVSGVSLLAYGVLYDPTDGSRPNKG